jgi:hypothetical protein
MQPMLVLTNSAQRLQGIGYGASTRAFVKQLRLLTPPVKRGVGQRKHNGRTF